MYIYIKIVIKVFSFGQKQKMTEIFMNDKQIAIESILELRMNQKGNIQAKKHYGKKQKI